MALCTRPKGHTWLARVSTVSAVLAVVVLVLRPRSMAFHGLLSSYDSDYRTQRSRSDDRKTHTDVTLRFAALYGGVPLSFLCNKAVTILVLGGSETAGAGCVDERNVTGRECTCLNPLWPRCLRRRRHIHRSENCSIDSYRSQAILRIRGQRHRIILDGWLEATHI